MATRKATAKKKKKAPVRRGTRSPSARKAAGKLKASLDESEAERRVESDKKKKAIEPHRRFTTRTVRSTVALPFDEDQMATLRAAADLLRDYDVGSLTKAHMTIAMKDAAIGPEMIEMAWVLQVLQDRAASGFKQFADPLEKMLWKAEDDPEKPLAIGEGDVDFDVSEKRGSCRPKWGDEAALIAAKVAELEKRPFVKAEWENTIKAKYPAGVSRKIVLTRRR